jgi:hypothetical protein
MPHSRFSGGFACYVGHAFHPVEHRSLACVATKQRERCMKWFTASNQTLHVAFLLLCETVYLRQPNKKPKLIFASHDAIQAPSACVQEAQKKLQAINRAPS